MEDNIYYFFIYFFSGAAVCNILMKMSRGFDSYMFHKTMELSILKVYRALDQDMRSAMKIKYISLRRSGVEDEQILKMAKSDQKVLNKWRESAITKLVTERPGHLVGRKNYKTWNEAMREIEKKG